MESQNKKDNRLPQNGFVSIRDGTVEWRFDMKSKSIYKITIKPVNQTVQYEFEYTENAPCTQSTLRKVFNKYEEEIVVILGKSRASNFIDKVFWHIDKMPKNPPSTFASFN